MRDSSGTWGDRAVHTSGRDRIRKSPRLTMRRRGRNRRPPRCTCRNRAALRHACHEGNPGLYHTLAGARLEEKKAAEEAARKEASKTFRCPWPSVIRHQDQHQPWRRPWPVRVHAHATRGLYRHSAASVSVGLALLCSVGYPRKVLRTQPTCRQPSIRIPRTFPGVIAPGTRVELITDKLNGTEGPTRPAGWHARLHGRGRKATDAHRQRRQALDVPRQHPVGRARLRPEGTTDRQRQYTGQAGDLHRPPERRREDARRQEHAGLHGRERSGRRQKGRCVFHPAGASERRVHPPGRGRDEDRRRERHAPERDHHEPRREDPLRERLARRIPPGV